MYYRPERTAGGTFAFVAVLLFVYNGKGLRDWLGLVAGPRGLPTRIAGAADRHVRDQLRVFGRENAAQVQNSFFN